MTEAPQAIPVRTVTIELLDRSGHGVARFLAEHDLIEGGTGDGYEVTRVSTQNRLSDLIARLTKANNAVMELAADAYAVDHRQHDLLAAKGEGIRLAQSYVRATLHTMTLTEDELADYRARVKAEAEERLAQWQEIKADVPGTASRGE